MHFSQQPRALPLGQLLVKSGLLTQQALDDVLAVQRTDGRRLGEILEAKGLVRSHQLAQFLSHQLSCPWVSLQRVEITREAVEVLPRAIALKHHMVPVHLRTSKGKAAQPWPQALYVAMDDPTDEVALSEASAATTMPVKPMVALASEIRQQLERLYGLDGQPTPRVVSTTAPPPAPPPLTATPTGAPAAPSPRDTIRQRAFALSDIPPTILMKEDGTRATPTRPPKPPPPKGSGRPPPLQETILDDFEIVDDGGVAPKAVPSEQAPAPTPRPAEAATRLLVIGAREEVLATIRRTASLHGADAVPTSIVNAASAGSEHAPCAIVVTEDVYANDRLGLDAIALDAGAQLVVSSDDFHDQQLEALIESVIRRWRRSSYEKGTILEGRYELMRDLGGRLPGSRWEVRHLRTARRSRLKIGVRSAQDGADADAIRREQMALARVHHPGAVDLRDAGNTELGDPYVIVEMLEGRSLEGLVTARGALPPDQAAILTHQIAQVLADAHDAGVRHGAVRPENVLIVRAASGEERAKLVQWEAATVMEDQEGGFDCTHNVAHDLAGLGACAFFAFAGRKRHEGEDVLKAGLPPKIADAVARALVGRNRFASVKELIRAFEQAVPGLGAAPRSSALGALELLAARPEQRGVSFGAAPSVRGSEATAETPTPDALEAPTLAELRRFGRAAYRTPVRIEIPGGATVDGRSEDISEGGLLVVTREQIAVGAELTLRFALPIDGNLIAETGIVRWVRAPRSSESGEPRALGVELTAVTEESVRQIARYLTGR